MSESLAQSPSEDDVSESSTIVYGHESFEEYVPRVRKLINGLFLFGTVQDVTVERMQGGGFNRVIGLSVEDHEETTLRRFVLRIPRFEAAQLTHDLAPLVFVRTQSGIPVPNVVAFDVSDQNALDSPYMIQQRLSGEPLISFFPTLNHGSRVQVARGLGLVYNTLTSLHSQQVGRLTALLDNSNIISSFMVETLEGTGLMKSHPYNNTPTIQNVAKTLIDIFIYRNGKALAQVPPDEFRSRYMKKCIEMTSQMDSLGYLKDVTITLCHLDLAPRNILVDVKDEMTQISGLLDWDSAVFGPSFLSCKPPSWIWDWKDDEDEDEGDADNVPPTPEARELKTVFETAAGPAYVRFAYDPVYRLARLLTHIAFFGIRSTQDCDEADTMLSAWSDLRQELMNDAQG